MLTFFIIVASFKEGDRPATQFSNWKTYTLEQCESNLQEALYALNLDFSVDYEERYKRRSLTTQGLSIYKNWTTTLNCVEVIVEQ